MGCICSRGDPFHRLIQPLAVFFLMSTDKPPHHQRFYGR
jgi:hypothetical protein